MLKRFISYYKPHKKMFILDMLASLLIALIGMTYPIITKSMLDDYIPNGNLRFIIIFGVVLFVLYVIRMLLRYFVQYYGHIIGVKMQAHMRKDMFSHLQTLPYQYYDDHETGKIMSRMTNDLMDVSELAHHGPENFLISGIMIVGSCIYLSTINLILTFIVFVCVPLLLVVCIILRKRMSNAFMESRKSIAVINAALESSISGIRVTKAFTNSDKEEEKFEVGNNQFVKFRCKAYKAMAQFHSSTSFITDFFNVVVLVAGGILIYYKKLDLVEYTTFIISVNLFINPLNTLIGFMEQYQNGVTGFKRFLEIVEQEPESEVENAVKINNVKGHIEFKNVDFKYSDSEDILKNVSLDLKVGEKVALVGPSGGGKTTICHLLPRFYNCTGGSILIDGVDIKDVSLKSLRQNIGIVQQDVFLFNGSMKENILYGRLDATDEEVEEAAKSANIHEYIMSLPNKYDTQIGERGVKLSGGQKQRLSIARVFLKNPSILILDEATSALDNTTEILIQGALEKLSVGRTTLVVAHRLSTIKNADNIVVISKGEVQEYGSHEQLMENGSIYKGLYNLQFRNN